LSYRIKIQLFVPNALFRSALRYTLLGRATKPVMGEGLKCGVGRGGRRQSRLIRGGSEREEKGGGVGDRQEDGGKRKGSLGVGGEKGWREDA
jgi:hypothetical protein